MGRRVQGEIETRNSSITASEKGVKAQLRTENPRIVERGVKKGKSLKCGGEGFTRHYIPETASEIPAWEVLKRQGTKWGRKGSGGESRKKKEIALEGLGGPVTIENLAKDLKRKNLISKI